MATAVFRMDDDDMAPLADMMKAAIASASASASPSASPRMGPGSGSGSDGSQRSTASRTSRSSGASRARRPGRGRGRGQGGGGGRSPHEEDSRGSDASRSTRRGATRRSRAPPKPAPRHAPPKPAPPTAAARMTPEEGEEGSSDQLSRRSTTDDDVAHVDSLLRSLRHDDMDVRKYLQAVRCELVRNRKQRQAVGSLLMQIRAHIQDSAAAASTETDVGLCAWDNDDIDKFQALLALLEARRRKMMEHVSKHVDLLCRVERMVKIQRQRSEALATLETPEAGHVLTQFKDFTAHFTSKAAASDTLIQRTRTAASTAITRMSQELKSVVTNTK